MWSTGSLRPQADLSPPQAGAGLLTYSRVVCVCVFIKLCVCVCERYATTRGCSGGRGSDDTRSYGVESGDVGKELPRG